MLYNPTDSEFVWVIQAEQKAIDPVGVSDPSVGLFSNTHASKGNLLNQQMVDGLTEIIKGTQPLGAFDQLCGTGGPTAATRSAPSSSRRWGSPTAEAPKSFPRDRPDAAAAPPGQKLEAFQL